MDERLSRLPKWAQERIQLLETNLASAQERIRLSEAQEPTRLAQGYDMRGGPGRWLPDDEVLTFYLEDAVRPLDTFSHVDFNSQGGGLYVNASERLVVCPEAANVIRLDVRKD